MWVRKDRAGSAGGATWKHDGDVVEVGDEMGAELLAIPGGGFSEAEEPKPPKKAEPVTGSKNDDADDGKSDENDPSKPTVGKTSTTPLPKGPDPSKESDKTPPAAGRGRKSVAE